MKRSTSRLAAAVAALTLTVGAGACSKAADPAPSASGGAQIKVAGDKYDGPNVTLEFWNPFTGPDGAYFKAMVDKFNSQTPNIKVNVTTMQASDLYSKFPVAVKSGKGPDVAVVHLHAIPTLAAAKNVLGLDAITTSLGLTEKDFAPLVWKGGIYQGTRYSIPLDMHMLGLFYNKTVLKKAGLNPDVPPKTGEEYAAALAALRKAGIQGQWIDSYGFMRLYYVTLLNQFGGQEFNEAGDKALWNSEAGVKALTWIQDLIKNGDSPKDVGADGYWAAFKDNKTAFVWGGIWALGDPDLPKIEWGVAPLPTIGTKNAVWSDSHQFVATTQLQGNADKTAAAAYFMNKISANSLEWAKANQVPARNSVRESAEFKALPGVTAFASQIDYVALPKPFPGLDEVNAELDKEMNKVLLLKAEPKAALDAAVAKADAILAANKAKYGY